MHPIKFEGSQGFGKPEGWDNDRDGVCLELPGKVEVLTPTLFEVQSIWSFTEEERKLIAEGHNISLRCVNGQPPVMLDVVDIQGPNAWPEDFEKPSAVVQHIDMLTKGWLTLIDDMSNSLPNWMRGNNSKEALRTKAALSIKDLVHYMDARGLGHSCYDPIDNYIKAHNLRT